MKTKPKFRLGDFAYCLGITTQKSGTQNPNTYYLPLKVQVWRVQEDYSWTDKGSRFTYGIIRPDNLKNRTKSYRNRPITETIHHYNLCNENQIFKNKKAALAESREWNASVRKYKNENKS